MAVDIEQSDHLVPKTEKTTIMDLDHPPVKIKRRVNFNLTIDIKQESNFDDALVPQGPHSLSDYSDGESLSEQLIPTTPGGKPQVSLDSRLILAVKVSKGEL